MARSESSRAGRWQQQVAGLPISDEGYCTSLFHNRSEALTRWYHKHPTTLAAALEGATFNGTRVTHLVYDVTLTWHRTFCNILGASDVYRLFNFLDIAIVNNDVYYTEFCDEGRGTKLSGSKYLVINMILMVSLYQKYILNVQNATDTINYVMFYQHRPQATMINSSQTNLGRFFERAIV